jgi:hypothetical protein
MDSIPAQSLARQAPPLAASLNPDLVSEPEPARNRAIKGLSLMHTRTGVRGRRAPRMEQT